MKTSWPLRSQKKFMKCRYDSDLVKLVLMMPQKGFSLYSFSKSRS
jgi:hypothetical protein